MTRSRSSAHIALYLLLTACGGGEGGDDDVRQVAPGDARQGADAGDAGAACTPQTEVCNGLDDNCDGRIDNNATDAIAFFIDQDGDGAGAGEPLLACSLAGDRVTLGGDCDDSNRTVFPGATEFCDGIDNDCNGLVDDGDSVLQYRDADEDLIGDSACISSLCAPLAGFVALGGDCDDDDDSVGRSSDCPPARVETAVPRFADDDGDGYGAAGAIVYACGSSPNSADNALDCDDDNLEIYPGAIDLCDGQDQDCDGTDNCPDGVSIRLLSPSDLLRGGNVGARLGATLHVWNGGETTPETLFAPFDGAACDTLGFAAPYRSADAQTLSVCAREASFVGGQATFCDYARCERWPPPVAPLAFDPPSPEISRPHLRLGPIVQRNGVSGQLVLWESEPFSEEPSVIAFYRASTENLAWSQQVASSAIRLASADANADGINDLLIADLDAGSVGVWFAPFGDSLFDEEPDARIVIDGRIGTSILVQDVIGSATDELVLGAPDHRHEGERVGAVFVFSLPLSFGRLGEDDAVFSLFGEQAGAGFGESLAGHNGHDIYVGTPRARFGAVAGGAVLRFPVPLADAGPAVFIYGREPGAGVGTSLAAPPLEGERVIVIGAPGSNQGAGALYSVREPISE